MNTAAVTRPAETLTHRESEVVAHLVDGLSNKQIAAVLGIATETVKEHVQNALKKFKCNSRSAIAGRVGFQWGRYLQNCAATDIRSSGLVQFICTIKTLPPVTRWKSQLK